MMMAVIITTVTMTGNLDRTITLANCMMIVLGFALSATAKARVAVYLIIKILMNSFQRNAHLVMDLGIVKCKMEILTTKF
ncbi:hypothetical protein A6769_39020 [Nostoc punctiforme NIES-2108]|uniref:Uncharacterized protein n=1 Tax=Nostoc punctiforme NIES-2108 TaxID=1356359 RepID=A0A367RX07_NOSPU|nr:hypothetical protein A6769_39020 [Nostoc punctiforme NIES-2108]